MAGYVDENNDFAFLTIDNAKDKNYHHRVDRFKRLVVDKEKLVWVFYLASHFAVLEIVHGTGCIKIYDSIPEYMLHQRNIWKKFQAFLNRVFEKPQNTKWEIEQPICPQQDNSVDCGVFAIVMYRNLVTGKDIFYKLNKSKRNTVSPDDEKANIVGELRKRLRGEFESNQLADDW